jgi:8-amino-7-oxononanoate synthase
MLVRIPEHFESQRRKRIAQDAVRSLRVDSAGVDLSSNDYLGIARKLASPEVIGRVLGDSFVGGVGGSHVGSDQLVQVGATGSRLVSGTTQHHEQLEEELAEFHQAESALLFGSGYEANLGLLSSLASRTDTIFYDELVHASMRDGIRLSPARAYSFRHNDVEDLSEKLKISRGECFIVIESLYSMDGDQAPLIQIIELAERVGAYVVVDEAHATGIYGPLGAGLVAELGLSKRVLARVHTFGKALGYRGACVVGGAGLRDHLINSARSFIYTTAADLVTLRFTKEAYRILKDSDQQRLQLQELIQGLRMYKSDYRDLRFLPSESPIQGVIVPGNSAALATERALQDAGFIVRAIRAPTVPIGTERIRICLHAFNSLDQVAEALAVIRSIVSKAPERVEGI